jgi:hypothetical protein
MPYAPKWEQTKEEEEEKKKNMQCELVLSTSGKQTCRGSDYYLRF